MICLELPAAEECAVCFARCDSNHLPPMKPGVMGFLLSGCDWQGSQMLDPPVQRRPSGPLGLCEGFRLSHVLCYCNYLLPRLCNKIAHTRQFERVEIYFLTVWRLQIWN